MPIPILMPKAGMAMFEGLFTEWLKPDGAHVNKDDAVATVESEKISFDVLAPADGTLHHIAKPGERIEVGKPVATLTLVGEKEELRIEEAPKAPVEEAQQKAAISGSRQDVPVIVSPATRRLAKEKGVDLAQVTGTGPNGRITDQDILQFLSTHESAPQPEEVESKTTTVAATPVARKVAELNQVDLEKVTGTGPHGKITQEDVQHHIDARVQAVVQSSESQVIPYRGMRRSIGDKLVHSLQALAQNTGMTEADVTETVRLRNQLKEKFKVTYTDIFVKAVALALKEFPILNARLVGEEIHLLKEIHIGVATSLENAGLIVPVIRNADRLSLREIGAESSRLVEAARQGKLTVDDATSGTFTITNAGMYGVDYGTPIINEPEVGILSIGRIQEKPAVYNGEIVARWMMGLSLSYDHRVLDGAPAMQFVAEVVHILQNPYLLLV